MVSDPKATKGDDVQRALYAIGRLGLTCAGNLDRRSCEMAIDC